MPETVEKIRAFVAIHPPREVMDRIVELMDDLKREMKGEAFRWVKMEQLHLTTQFLGYIPRQHLDAHRAAIEKAVSAHHALRLNAEGLGCFPSVPRARVLWVGLKGDSRELQELKLDMDHFLAPLGCQVEERPFHPHLTLARIAVLSSGGRARLKQQIERHASQCFGQWQVRTVDLMQSVLSPKGASYHRLESYSLKSA